MKLKLTSRPRKLLLSFAVPVLGNLFAPAIFAASVCTDSNSNLIFSDNNISGNGQNVWVGGFNDGNWMWTGELTCSAGECASTIQYSGGQVQFRMEGPGVEGYYSPPGYGNMHPAVTPSSCGGTATPTLPQLQCQLQHRHRLQCQRRLQRQHELQLQLRCQRRLQRQHQHPTPPQRLHLLQRQRQHPTPAPAPTPTPTAAPTPTRPQHLGQHQALAYWKLNLAR